MKVFSLISGPGRNAFAPMIYSFNIEEVKEVVMTITTTESYVKTFNANDCLGSSLNAEVSRYVQEFTFTQGHVYQSTCRQDEIQSIPYSVSFVATFDDDTTTTLTYTNRVIPSI